MRACRERWNGASSIASSTSATPAALTMYQGHGPSTESSDVCDGTARKNM